jgi:RNA polymerase sigma factor (TIGR02999 family)
MLGHGLRIEGRAVSSSALPEDVTDLLRRMGSGDVAASERLVEILHADLRHMAAKFLAGERDAHTLQPTALVHEAWLRLMPAASRGLQDRGHFMALAARAMRRILVDHARARRRDKRGGDWQRVSLSAVPPGTSSEAVLAELLDLDSALDRLAEKYERPARVVELRAFGGLTIEETAEALDVVTSTVEEDWAFAKAWLARALRQG